MHILPKKQFTQQVEPILHKIFVGNDDTEPFLDNVEERLLLYYPCGGDPKKNYYWERKLAESLAYASQFIGETECYLISEWEREPTVMTSIFKNHYACVSSSELADALAAPPGSSKLVWAKLSISPSNFCLCSAKGNWGLLTTLDDYGFLGGSSEFMQAVHSYFPEIEKEVSEWLENLRLEQMDGEKINVKYVKQILNHVYGSALAEQMITDSELVKLPDSD